MKKLILTGLAWMTINLVLDIFIVVPLAKMELKDYMVSVGLRYLQTPMLALITGLSLQPETETSY
jgi:hypothetical protein